MTLVHIIGCIEGNYTGYGVYTRGLWEALQRYKAPNLEFKFTEFRDSASFSQAIRDVGEYKGAVKNIWLQVGPGDQFLKYFSGEKISYTMYEASELPSGWSEGLNRADRVFTPSVWGKEVMQRNGVQNDKIFVVPGGVDAEAFNFWGPQLDLPKEPFKFLMVGKYEVRKGYDETLRAFKETFNDDPNVLLLLKATSFVDGDAVKQIQMKIAELGVSQAKLVDGAIKTHLMAALYRSCDCLIFPSRGEGWGLPLIEAMAAGLPVLTTNCSGQSEFLRDFKGRFGEIKADLKPLVAADHTKWYEYDAGPGDWYVPNYASLKKGLRRAYEGKIAPDAKALAVDVMNRYSWDSAAQRFLGTLFG
jgi:glycosyltransferase involved in cell wall biosynthesis